MKLYKKLAVLFWFYRQYVISNPFEVLGEGITITVGESPILLSPDVLNYLADPIIFTITYGIVGLYYKSGSAPVLGSVMYMLFYCIHIGGIYFLMSLYPTIWLINIILIGYLGFHILAVILKNSLLVT